MSGLLASDHWSLLFLFCLPEVLFRGKYCTFFPKLDLFDNFSYWLICSLDASGSNKCIFHHHSKNEKKKKKRLIWFQWSQKWQILNQITGHGSFKVNKVTNIKFQDHNNTLWYCTEMMLVTAKDKLLYIWSKKLGWTLKMKVALWRFEH